MITYDPDLKIFYSTKINDAKHFSGFSTRDLGDARASTTVVNFIRQQVPEVKNVVILRQIHSTNIEIVQNTKTADILDQIEDTDALITTLPLTALVVRNADCVPLIILDKTKGMIGISHQGWRGSLKRLPRKMVERFTAFGSNAKNLICTIGPSIGDCCYDIDEDRYYAFLEEFDGYSDKIFYQRKGKRHLNLSYLNYLQLVDAGVKKENIDYFPFCTKCDEQRFFSRRRVNHDNHERMFNFVLKRS